MASRIRPLAEPGGVVVSGPVYDSIKNQPEIDAAPKGEQTLKNVAAPVAVWSVTGTPGAPAAISHVPATLRRRTLAVAAGLTAALVTLGVGVWWSRTPAVGATPIRSLAVLPLHDPAAAEHGPYFSFGMTEALIADLAKLRELRVISRTSVTPYEGTALSIRQIATELGVDGIIEGSVLRSGDRRPGPRYRPADRRAHRYHLWAESYERDMGDILALQAEVARKIATRSRSSSRRSPRGPPRPRGRCRPRRTRPT